MIKIVKDINATGEHCGDCRFKRNIGFCAMFDVAIVCDEFGQHSRAEECLQAEDICSDAIAAYNNESAHY